MLRVSLLPKQRQVFYPDDGADVDVKLYQGGFGAGKTFLGVIKGLSVLSANPGATWLVGADTWSRLQKTTWQTYERVLSDAGIRYKTNQSNKTIKIPRLANAMIMFTGLDDPKALRSVNGIGGHLEESSLLTLSAYEEFIGRLRQAEPGVPIQVILTTNPQPQKGWQYDLFHTRAGRHEVEIRGKTVVVNRRRVIASTLENPHVSDAFIANMQETYDPDLYRIVVLGEDGDYTRGLVSHNFSDLNVLETNLRPDLPLYLSCDFNVDPMSWVVAHRFNGEYHFFDEIVVENTNINECIDVFVSRYPSISQQVIITGDASGNNRDVRAEKVGGTSYTQMVNRFRFHGFDNVRVDVRQANPRVMDRVAAWNAMMCNTTGVRRIFINPRCKWLISNLQNLRYKEGTGEIEEPTAKEIQKDPKKKFIKHIFDAASYLVEKYDPIILQSAKEEPAVMVPSALKFRR